MQTRKLGRTGLKVAALWLGGDVFGWTADERASFAGLDAYVEGGGNFIDPADVYPQVRTVAWTLPGGSGITPRPSPISTWIHHAPRRYGSMTCEAMCSNRCSTLSRSRLNTGTSR